MPTKKKEKEIVLPDPECKAGYTRDQVREILGDNLDEFDEFMVGQTQSVCDGQIWNHDEMTCQDSDCGPHGVVTYGIDIKRFLVNASR